MNLIKLCSVFFFSIIKIKSVYNSVGSGLKKNHVRVFYDISPKFDAIGLVCLPDFSTFDDISENVCLINEAVRSATSGIIHISFFIFIF